MMANTRFWNVLHRRAGPWIRRADEANRSQNWDQARHAYSIALKIKPNLHSIWIQYGHVLNELNQIDMAISAYRQSTVLKPVEFDGYFHLGRAQLRAAQPEAALLTFRAALELNPDHQETSQHVHELSRAIPQYKMDQVELLTSNGISDKFINFFDWEYYVFFNKIATPLYMPSEIEALKSFVSVGIDQILPAHERWNFDPEYYHRRYSTTQRTPLVLYWEWLSSGIDAGHSPNIIHELETRLFATGLTKEVIERILGKKAYLLKSNPEKASEAFIYAMTAEHPAYMRDLKLLNYGNVQFFSAMSDAFYLNGKKDESIALRKHIIDILPHFPAPRQHLADWHLDNEEYRLSISLYEYLIEDGTASPWTYLNLARCYRNIGEYETEIAVVRAAITRFPGDRGFVRELVNSQDRYFHDKWTKATNISEYESVTDAQQAVADACRQIAPASDSQVVKPRPATGRRAIALIANEGLEQCRLYRVEQKVEQLRAAGCKVEKFNSDYEIDKFLASIDCFDVAIFYRVPAFPGMIRAINEANIAGLVTVYEIDDLIFDVCHYPPPLPEYGGLVTYSEYISLAMGVPLFRHAMQMCEYALASTSALADVMAPLVRSGRSFVHRNAIGSKHRDAIATPPRSLSVDTVTIIYGSGTKAHKKDFTEIAEPALIEVARRHAHVRIVLVGYKNVGPELAELGSQLILIDPISDIQIYWELLKDADINIAVLQPSLVADCKSEIKWLEASMLGIPSVLSWTRTYEEVVKHGETGFLCRTARDWEQALERLVTDKAFRHQIGNAARDAVLREYSETAMAENLTSVISEVMPPIKLDKKRIAIVNVFYPPQAIGGATRVVHDNVCSFIKSYADSFEVEVFSSIQGDIDAYKVTRQIVDGVRVTGVATPNDPTIDDRTVDSRMGEIFDHFLTAAKIDMIHFHCVQRLTADLLNVANRRDIPYVITAHDGWWISNEQFLVNRHDQITSYDYTLSPIERAQFLGQKAFSRMSMLEGPLNRARWVLPVSVPFATIYREAGVQNIKTIANGVSQLPQRHRIAAPDEKIRLAHIGGASRHKGYHLVRQALWCGNYSNLSLTVIDHGMPAGTWRNELWGTTPVRILPRFEQDSVARLYHETDILLAPSIWPESHGLVTREALASGCWVIASDRGAIGSDVTEDLNGHIINVSDAAALAALFKEIDLNPSRYRSMPDGVTIFRTASEQADELAALYLGMFEETSALHKEIQVTTDIKNDKTVDEVLR